MAIKKNSIKKNTVRRSKSQSKKRKISKKFQNGGLALYSSNMDCNAPFHPIWKNTYNPKVANTACNGMNSYAFIQEGGKNKKKSKKSKK